MDVLRLDGRPDRTSGAKVAYDTALARNIGIAFEGRCKTERWTICRLNIPFDDEDARYRMIPQTGVKLAVTVEPLPTLLRGE